MKIEREVIAKKEFKPAKKVKIEGPLISKVAEELVLRVLAEAQKPLTRKEIVEKVGEMIAFTEKDLQPTKSGHPRWETKCVGGSHQAGEYGIV